MEPRYPVLPWQAWFRAMRCSVSGAIVHQIADRAHNPTARPMRSRNCQARGRYDSARHCCKYMRRYLSARPCSCRQKIGEYQRGASGFGACRAQSPPIPISTSAIPSRYRSTALIVSSGRATQHGWWCQSRPKRCALTVEVAVSFSLSGCCCLPAASPSHRQAWRKARLCANFRAESSR